MLGRRLYRTNCVSQWVKQHPVYKGELRSHGNLEVSTEARWQARSCLTKGECLRRMAFLCPCIGKAHALFRQQEHDRSSVQLLSATDASGTARSVGRHGLRERLAQESEPDVEPSLVLSPLKTGSVSVDGLDPNEDRTEDPNASKIPRGPVCVGPLSPRNMVICSNNMTVSGGAAVIGVMT